MTKIQFLKMKIKICKVKNKSNGERIVFSTNGAGIPRYSDKRMTVSSFLTTHIRSNLTLAS